MSESKKQKWSEWKQPLVIIGALSLLALGRDGCALIERSVDIARLPEAIEKGNAQMLGVVSNNTAKLDGLTASLDDFKRSADTNFMVIHATVNELDYRQQTVYEFLFSQSNNAAFKSQPKLDFDGFKNQP